MGLWIRRYGLQALPNTGALMRVNGDGTLTTVVGGLDRPTSVEIIKHTAYVVNLAGEVWKIEGIKKDRDRHDHDDRGGGRGGDRD